VQLARAGACPPNVCLDACLDACLLRHAIWLLCRAGLPIIHQLPCRLYYFVLHEVQRMVEIATYRGYLLRLRVFRLVFRMRMRVREQRLVHEPQGVQREPKGVHKSFHLPLLTGFSQKKKTLHDILTLYDIHRLVLGACEKVRLYFF